MASLEEWLPPATAGTETGLQVAQASENPRASLRVDRL